ncbi:MULTISPECIES: DNA polymerase III subunit gamma/tau [Leuconostoc]|uniref:DNA-directed DNA polymerase n=1 Tax=Leuconostoc pseudomesenteroides TaxID=33968 RepID=A0A5B8SV90_LEUPS|nr:MULTISPECIES: DNA polymerase III subunit gamma/tau [Leuconostoc]MCC8440080.1 DNA polymerase III subunit gamma/tau [Leuconostoc pseudomesenteroides]MDG9732599.1 DNA polymerase III subunit gamma/tau [Leuconostoc pseudomesenteroides]MDN2450009.1 DNA polymerase III subunit gamma/tau [Leuconostoc sp. UCMA20149]NKZ36896.1 DNA polymerase III subunit gamma/tau [Leuconostoc pseudomesenteroides]QEA41172.1 DNA polymerase III subunit gamma/tau [Leuconostoc pseudomesenteroides]
MAYQALYRVYRPRTFDDMVGQEVITQTLKNAIEAHQTGHAYLFSGPRGTGKTSAAKIFAREVNGISPDTDETQIPDIIEIDAASNNGVDEIRNIRDSANYAPIEAQYKIYIIDEVHMLSTGAFNALLKTLEEPPANVKFILATTEPQKIPATILSRTQRFDFKRIDDTTIQTRMAAILDKQSVEYDQDALRVIANAAEGGMRDALSILDQVIAYGSDKVTVENALQVTGSTTTEALLSFLQQVSEGDTRNALQTLHMILLDGKDAQRFVADMIGLLRDVMLSPIAPNLIKTTASVELLKQLNQKIGQQRIQIMMLALDETQKELLQTMQSDVYLELLTVKLSLAGSESTPTSSKINHSQSLATPKHSSEAEPSVSPSMTVDDMSSPITKPSSSPVKSTNNDTQSDTQQSALTQEKIANVDPEPVSQPVASNKKLSARTGQEAVFAVLSVARRETLTSATQLWPELQQQFDVAKQAFLTIAKPVAASDEAIVLAFDYPALLAEALQDAELQAQLVQQLSESNLPFSLVLISKDEWKIDRAAYVSRLRGGEKITVKLSDIPVVKANVEKIPVEQDDTVAVVNDTPEIVKQAQSLFGEDLVNIVD